MNTVVIASIGMICAQTFCLPVQQTVGWQRGSAIGKPGDLETSLQAVTRAFLNWQLILPGESDSC
jgi:hypothetical protein